MKKTTTICANVIKQSELFVRVGFSLQASSSSSSTSCVRSIVFWRRKHFVRPVLKREWESGMKSRNGMSKRERERNREWVKQELTIESHTSSIFDFMYTFKRFRAIWTETIIPMVLFESCSTSNNSCHHSFPKCFLFLFELVLTAVAAKRFILFYGVWCVTADPLAPPFNWSGYV